MALMRSQSEDRLPRFEITGTEGNMAHQLEILLKMCIPGAVAMTSDTKFNTSGKTKRLEILLKTFSNGHQMGGTYISCL